MTPFFFRLDISPRIGVGHLRRCLVLAHVCAELDVVPHFLIRHEDLDLTVQKWPKHHIIHKIPWNATPEEDAALIAEICDRHSIQSGIIDHYRIPDTYQKMLLEAGLHWMQFGNKVHGHPLLGLLVHDANPGATRIDYQTRIVGDSTRFLFGPEYALVGEEFRILRKQLLEPHARGGEDSILLTFGGGDDGGAILRALDWLDAADYAGKRVVATTSLNPNLPILKQRACETNLVELQINNWNLAPVMARCQLALCAGGTSLHELACLGVPPVIVCIAENQFFPAQSWHQSLLGKNLGILGDVNDDDAVKVLRHLLCNPDARLEMAKRCWLAQDGEGAYRVAKALM